MISALSEPKTKTMNLRRRDEQIENFFNEVDLGKINLFESEESFQELLEAFRRKASVLPKYMNLDGLDVVEFKIFCPFPHFCAIVSKFSFDRKIDFSFRYINT
jgi:hypothetical protein